MAAVAKLQLSLSDDGLPDHVPATLTEWLRLIRLESYIQTLISQGFTTVQQMITISVEDLEDIGFYKLGHQKRLMLAIKKVKELSQKQRKTNFGRKSFTSFNSSVADVGNTDDTPVSMPEPMQPIHNPLYLNTLVPYLDSLALPKQDDTFSTKTKQSFSSLPPKSKPVAKVPANTRQKLAVDNEAEDLSLKSDYHKTVNNIDKMSKFKENSDFNRTLCFKPSNRMTKSETEDVTYTNIPITKLIQNGHKSTDYHKPCKVGNNLTNEHQMTRSEFTPSSKISVNNSDSGTRARTR